jgi:hypothetical protein
VGVGGVDSGVISKSITRVLSLSLFAEGEKRSKAMTKKSILYMLKNPKYKRKLEMQVTARVVVMLPNREAMPSKISGEGKLPMTCMFLGRGFTRIGRFAGLRAEREGVPRMRI